MNIKKVFNLEEDLTSDEFIENKQDMISERCQLKHPDFLCKVYTYCTQDKKFVVHTTEQMATSVGALSKMLAHRPVGEQALLALDNDMVNTWEIIITADTDLPDYLTALDVAQAKADAMMMEDKSKMPIVTVIDYRWGNPVAQIVPTIFGDTDENGRTTPPVQTMPIYVGGNSENGKVIIDEKELISNLTDEQKAIYDQYDHSDPLDELRIRISLRMDVTNYDVSSLTKLSYLFHPDEKVQNITWSSDQINAFKEFNQDISSWDVSNVTNMKNAFHSAFAFNQDISSWDVSNVTSFEGMFYYAYLFDCDIGSWNVSNATKMTRMFTYAKAFNQDISSWDTSNVTIMYGMFLEAKAFNQDISSWNTSNVTDMTGMFRRAESFNQDISSWDVSNITDANKIDKFAANSPIENTNKVPSFNV